MAFQTGSFTSLFNLFSTLNTFLTANGWTADDTPQASPARAAWHKNTSPEDVFVQVQYPNANVFTLYGSRGFGGSPADPDSHPGSTYAGSGNTMTVNFDELESPLFQNANYWFFERDADPAYIHVVLEYFPGYFRHFGWGQLQKVGTWTGGMYVQGHYWEQSTTHIDVAASQSHRPPWDAVANGDVRGGHIHAEGLVGMTTSPLQKWLMNGALSTGNDGDGVAKKSWIGGNRGGYQNNLHNIGQAQLNGYQPLHEIPIWYNDNAAAPDQMQLIGYAPDVRTVNMQDLDAAEVLAIGSPIENWYVFPLVRKTLVVTDDTESSTYMGLAYLRNNA